MKRMAPLLLVLCLLSAAAADTWEEGIKSFDIEALPSDVRQEIRDYPRDISPGPRDDARDDAPVAFMREQVISERWYIFALCMLSLISLVTVLLFLKSTPHSARDIVNASGLNLIIFGTIILVMIVDTSEQLTAAIGVLAAIAGYLFGTMQRKF